MYLELCPLVVDRVTEDESGLVERKILFCAEAKQFKVQSVELVQFSYRLWIDSPESLECPEKGTQMHFQGFHLFWDVRPPPPSLRMKPGSMLRFSFWLK